MCFESFTLNILFGVVHTTLSLQRGGFNCSLYTFRKYLKYRGYKFTTCQFWALCRTCIWCSADIPKPVIFDREYVFLATQPGGYFYSLNPCTVVVIYNKHSLFGSPVLEFAARWMDLFCMKEFKHTSMIFKSHYVSCLEIAVKFQKLNSKYTRYSDFCPPGHQQVSFSFKLWISID